jgi:hypothetical protein
MACFVLEIAFIYWILCPISRAAKTRQFSFRFGLSDFFSLCVMIQVPFGIGYWLVSRHGNPRNLVGALFALSVIAGGLLWLVGVDNLSRANIRSGVHRMVCLTLIIPVTFVGCHLWGAMSSEFAVALYRNELPPDFSKLSLWVPLWCVLSIALITCGKYTRWLVRRTDGQNDGAKVPGLAVGE